MTGILQQDKNFKEAIGAFIIAYSELEFGLVFLCSMTDFDLRKKDSYIVKYMGFAFEKKMQLLTDFINEHLPALKPIWDKQKHEIGEINRERRFLAHGFMAYGIPKESITTYIKEKSKITRKHHSLADIKKLTNRLHHLNTGENGINGEFHTLFTKLRVDQWNKIANDESKIIYRLNDKILSEWKG